MLPFKDKSVCLIGPVLLPLSSPHPDFDKDKQTFTNCLLLHYLLATGKGDEVLKRRQELSPSLLSHTCAWGPISEVR